MGCGASKPSGDSEVVKAASSGAERFGEEQDNTDQETRILASNKAQAARPDEIVFRTSYVVTQLRGLSTASAAYVCCAEGNSPKRRHSCFVPRLA